MRGGAGQGAVAQGGASGPGEDAVDVQGLPPGPPGRPVAATRRTKDQRQKDGEELKLLSCHENLSSFQSIKKKSLEII